jgi:hypothetical protein
VVRQCPRNTYITMNTRIIASPRVFTTSKIEISTKRDVS